MKPTSSASRPGQPKERGSAPSWRSPLCASLASSTNRTHRGTLATVAFVFQTVKAHLSTCFCNASEINPYWCPSSSLPVCCFVSLLQGVAMDCRMPAPDIRDRVTSGSRSPFPCASRVQILAPADGPCKSGVHGPARGQRTAIRPGQRQRNKERGHLCHHR